MGKRLELVLKPKWNKKRAVRFLSIYSWNKETHRSQVTQFKTLKILCDPAVVSDFAKVVSGCLVETFGSLEGLSVSSCPRGHSSRHRPHFAAELARGVAAELGLCYRPLFVDRELKGKTHPRNFDERGEIVAVGLDGVRGVVLIDDVASSGTTIEQCVKALTGAFVIPVVLIYEDA